jgi:stearoyl-CoA desaturase (delta-9 desaturase)
MAAMASAQVSGLPEIEARRDRDEVRLPLSIRVRLPLLAAPLEFNRFDVLARLVAVAILGSLAFSIYWFWQHGVRGFDVAIFIAMNAISALGTTVGYHRLFAHRAFEAPAFWRGLLGIWGALAMQGPILYWVSVHRKHHRYPDAAEDPHAPIWEGKSWRASPHPVRAIYRSFFGWMFDGTYRLYPDYVRDLRKDPVVLWIDRFYPLWVALGVALPGLAGWLWYGDAQGLVSGLLAGGPIRMFYCISAASAVNAFAHGAGARPYRTGDDSGNNRWVNLVSLIGEGLHNNHHAFPHSARFSLAPGEIDPVYLFIRLLVRLGGAHSIREPSPAALA